MKTEQMPERISITTPSDMAQVDYSLFWVSPPCPGGEHVVKGTGHDYAEYVRADVAQHEKEASRKIKNIPTHIRITKDSIPVHDIHIDNKELNFRVDMNGVDVIETRTHTRRRFSPLRIFSSKYCTRSIYASFHWFGANGAQFISLNSER